MSVGSDIENNHYPRCIPVLFYLLPAGCGADSL